MDCSLICIQLLTIGILLILIWRLTLMLKNLDVLTTAVGLASTAIDAAVAQLTANPPVAGSTVTDDDVAELANLADTLTTKAASLTAALQPQGDGTAAGTTGA